MKYQLLSKLSINGRRGYTLLFAVIVSVLVLSVAAFILSISRKQFILSSSARDSMYAFYSSDSGLECGNERYNDKDSVLSTTSLALGGNINVACGTGGPWVGAPSSGASPQGATTTWQMPMPVLGGEQNACAIVTAAFHSTNPDGTGATVYTITSLGYNVGWDKNSKTCSVYGPRRVERALRYTINF